MKQGDKVNISNEAVVDSKLPTNEGTIKRLFNEPAVGIGEADYKLVEIEFEDGSTGVVGQHEIDLK